ncbi:anhydro-N-acetylmuramic acid kinase [Thiomicrorhabdus immobilis]|uniref:Anhydro-N-acetylmuramic acid kinase n=1 Tax=Thiomicrorhabdus immobilis TaxID=2791037 RepID=A0ABM7MBC4_9GAMM|nr:anhydro-N-acetylmuramic acid kinase [Thiomicrorhabdus immobilis]BCN92628.1 anhydro-N-acetylmuramic acid kinase [Thiomicrorhabdus immobilis]
MAKQGYFIGLMSGTSADGVDAALIDTSNGQVKLLDFCSTELSHELKEDLLKLNQDSNIHLEKLCLLHKQVADAFIEATQNLLSRNRLNSSEITAIGSHGQTIYHAPQIPMTLQIGHPAFIAKQTGITTIGDFRTDDMALNGQGAPFAPAFHKALFSEENPSFAVNIGGIANISFLPGIDSALKVIGWDTGPGNALMDEICHSELNIHFDPAGENARRGKPNPTLLKTLLKHPYFSQTHPKSTGRDTFNNQWVNQIIQDAGIRLSSEDKLATFCELTAISIAQQIESVQRTDSELSAASLWVVGGGAYNDFLLERLQKHLPLYKVASSETIGVNPNAVEAMMCGWLAEQRILNKTVELAAVTGAKRDAVLGGIWHP